MPGATRASHWSVRTFLTWLVLACLLPGVIGAAILFTSQYKQGRSQQEKDTIQTSRALMQATDSLLRTTQAIALTLSTHDSLLKHDYARFHQRARDVLALSRIGANVVLMDESGQQLVNTAVEFGKALPPSNFSQGVRQVFAAGKPVISDLFVGAPLKSPIVSINVPVIIDGKVAYVLGMGIPPNEFNALLQTQNLPAGWIAAVLDSSGAIVGRSRTPEKFIGRQATPALMKALLASPEGAIQATTQEGTPVSTAYSRSRSTGWAVAIGIPTKSLADALILPLSTLAAGVVALFAIGLVLAWLVGERIAGSVRALTAPAVALGKGSSMPLPQVHVREAAEVGLAISRASELLEERTAALVAREMDLAHAHARLRDVIDSAPALIYLEDMGGKLLLMNKEYERLIGADGSRARKIGGRAGQPSRREDASVADTEVLQRGGTVQFEEEVETSEGMKYFSVSKAALRDPEGTVIGICAAAVDVTSLRNAQAQVRLLVDTLERRVEQRTEELNQVNAQLLGVNAELQEANDQLEAFSYTVAHDLRAPLRGIQGFADALGEDYEDKLDATAHDYLQRITKAAARLERLIDDLLSYSRLSRMELPLGPVSLDGILAEVRSYLSVQIETSKAVVEVAPHLPRVRANQTACLHVFQNLVSNALKFARPDAAPFVKIWTAPAGLEQSARPSVRIWVEDNGIGIPAEKLERIFKPFERLHGVSEYPGSGIGLAVVDKAVRRMAGSCGVESSLETGSRFWVELPLAGVEKQ